MVHNKSGQMSLVMIIAIAIALIFLAMTMNWNKAAQLKTQCQIAATTSAATLVSRMASYGQNVLMVQLGGKREICNWTGVFAAFLMVVLIIVIIIVSIYCQACGAALSSATGGLGMTGLYIALALSVATLVIQAAVIQPAITKMWNKLQQNIKTVEDKVLEAGLQSGLQSAVTDTEQIRDVLDYNMNGRWNLPGYAGSTDNDMIARLVYHYTKRLRAIDPPDASPYEAFKTGLRTLMTDLGMLVDDSCCTSAPANFCNSACLPADTAVLADVDNDAIASACQTSPFSGYPFSYDPLFCDRNTATTPPTLVWLLGRDDSNQSLVKGASYTTSSTETFGGSGVFRKEDSDGALFPLLWELKELDDNKANVSSDASRIIYTDDVTASVQSFIAHPDPNACPGANGNGLWRPGNDLFCAQNLSGGDYIAPHHAMCAKFTADCQNLTDVPADCTCPAGASNPAIWYDDIIDDHWVSLREIAARADKIINDSANALMSQMDLLQDEVNQGVAELQIIRGNFTNWSSTLMAWYANAVHTKNMYPMVPNSTGTPVGIFCEASAQPQELAGATVSTLQGVINCVDYYANTAVSSWNACLSDCSNWQGICNTKTANCTAAQAACSSCTASLSACVTACGADPVCVAACGDCSGPCGSATAICADAVYFCAHPEDVASCINRPRTLAPPDPVDGILLDNRPVDCTASSKFLSVLPDSRDRAVTAAPSFATRLTGLNRAQTRGQALLDYLPAAITNGFAQLDNIPILFQAAMDASAVNPQVSSYITYGWESRDKKLKMGENGRVHIVKVEAWSPKRCAGWNCQQNAFPWVATRKKGSFKRCYYITATDGYVKARVTRFDEETPGGILRFLGNNLAFWQVMGRHPAGMGASIVADLQTVRGQCFGQDNIPLDSAMTPNRYDIPYSFMINGDTDGIDRYGSICLGAVNNLLRRGFVTEVCARYYLSDTYRMQFVPCY